MKLKASAVLQAALSSILDGHQNYACAAIQDIETTARMVHNENVTSNAQKVFNRFMPASVNPAIKLFGQWWPKHAPERIEALKQAIAAAEKVGD